MKQILPIILLISGLTLSAQIQTSNKGIKREVSQKQYNLSENRYLDFSWQTPETDLSQNHNEDSKDSKMVMDDNGTMYVIYNDDKAGVDDALQKILVMQKTINGDWTTPEVIDAGWPYTPYHENGVNGTKPNICISPNGDLHAVWLMWDFPGRILAYAKYDANTSTWLQADTISQAGGSLGSWYFPEIYSTNDNKPVIVWAEDDRTGTKEAYMKYHNGTNWSDDILVSTDDNFQAIDPKIVKLPNNKCLISFIEQIDETTMAIKYCIYNEADHTRSDLQIIPQTQYSTSTYYFNAELKLKNNNEVIMGMWSYEEGTNPVVNKISIWNYNITTDEFTKSENEFVSSESGSINQKYFDIAFDSDGDCAFVYSNSYDNNLHFVQYNQTVGFGESEIISTLPAVAAGTVPSIAFDTDNNLNVIFDDNRFDQNNDGYQDRDVLYLRGNPQNVFVEEIISNESSLSIYPNPANNLIVVTNLANEDIQILDITGKIIRLVKSNETKQSIDISDLQKGIYFIKVGQETQKLIKQ